MSNTKRLFARRETSDMTEGSIVGNIVRFALPLLAGNLFQQLYNMVDTWVVGQRCEVGVYAAVGSVGPIINILIGFFLGLSTGAGAVISQYFGAKKEDKVHDAVHTAIAMTLVLCVLFTVVGVLMTPTFLNILLRGKEGAENIYPHAKTYLTIYFSGATGLMIYNIGSGILRAVGDSRRPFVFLIVSAVTNTVLDILFVFQFGMGAAGVALATIIAQFLSAVLVVIVLLRSKSAIRLNVRDIRIDRKMLGRIVRVGIPAAVQMAITAFSNVFVQSYIAGVNGNIEYCLGGWTSYSKLDQFIFLPLQSLALSVTTFVAQNLGCGNSKRAKKGTWLTYAMATGVTVVLIATMMIFAPAASAFFNADPGVVACSTELIRALTPFYVFCCVNQIFSGALRGAGNSTAPMVFMLASFVGFRQLYLFVMSNYISNDLIPIAMSYPAGWGVCAVLTIVYFLIVGVEKNRIKL